MKRFLVIPFCCLVSFAFGQASFQEKVTNASNVRLSVTNVGTFGNAFRGYRDGSGDQSCEYPAGSGIEHLFESGIWFGGKIGGQEVVSTSAFDAPQGYAPGRAGFEFTSEIGSTLQERSSLFDSPFFSPDAVSHQDFVANFSDKNIIIPGTQIQISSHDIPMNVDVRMETYNWNFSFSDFFVILNFTVTNKGPDVIEDAYFGLWANTVVRNLNITAAGSGGANFYNKGGNGFMDSLNMAYCYDHSGDVGFTNSYIGQRFLGAEDKNGFHHPDINLDFESHYNSWEFNNTTNPVFFAPSTDNARYLKLTNGLNKHECWVEDATTNDNCPTSSFSAQLNNAGNRSDIVSVGPFVDFAPGDEINVVYAFIIGKAVEDDNPSTDNNLVQRGNLIANSDWAQTAFNGEDINFNGVLDPGEDNDNDGEITRFILPSPPDIPRTKIVASENKVDIFWSNNSEESIDPITQRKDFEGYRIYLTKLGFDVTKVPNLQEDYVKVAEYDIKGNNLFNEIGFASVRLEQPEEIDGQLYFYKYTIDGLLNGWQYAAAVTTFDQGNPESNLESLETSPLANTFRVFPGKEANEDPKENKPFAYPNPYYSGAAWEGASSFQEESRKLIFANLPRNCRIRVFTAAGDLIDEILHTEEYDGTDIRWFDTFADESPENNVFSGGEHAWDLLSKDTQIIARGVYLFTVKDLDTDKLYKGKFVVIK